MLATLDNAYAPHLIVGALVEVGLTASDLAVASGAHKRTAAAWVDGTQRTPKKKRHKERLAELKEVARFVVDNGTIAYQEADWLRHPNRTADFQTPLQLIRVGEWRQAVQVYCDDVAIRIPPPFLPAQSGSADKAKTDPHRVSTP